MQATVRAYSDACYPFTGTTRPAAASGPTRLLDPPLLAEFGTLVRLPRDEREIVVSALRDDGMSLRAIGSALGVDDKTVRNDLAGAEKSAPVPTPAADPLAAKIAVELAASDHDYAAQAAASIASMPLAGSHECKPDCKRRAPT